MFQIQCGIISNTFQCSIFDSPCIILAWIVDLWTIINVSIFFFLVDSYLPCSESPKGANNASTFQRKVISFLTFHKAKSSSFSNSLFLSTLYFALRPPLVSMVFDYSVYQILFSFFFFWYMVCYVTWISWLSSASSAQLVFALWSVARRKGSPVC